MIAFMVYGSHPLIVQLGVSRLDTARNEHVRGEGDAKDKITNRAEATGGGRRDDSHDLIFLPNRESLCGLG